MASEGQTFQRCSFYKNSKKQSYTLAVGPSYSLAGIKNLPLGCQFPITHWPKGTGLHNDELISEVFTSQLQTFT